MPTENSDQRRREIIRELEDEKRAAQVKKARPSADVDAQLFEIEARLHRAKSPPPSPELCVDCWVLHGEQLKMLPRSSPPGVDIFGCGNGHERRVNRR